MLRDTNTSPLKEKSFNLALRIVKLYQHLTVSKNEYVLSKQILRSGTNPGSMVRESVNAESPADFIHKLSIGLKELSETEYWLELIYRSGYINEVEYNSLNADTVEVGKMLTASIKTKKKNITLSTITVVCLLSIIIFQLVDS
jgi:four helix bundle protein